jgi:hypothetical protein
MKPKEFLSTNPDEILKCNEPGDLKAANILIDDNFRSLLACSHFSAILPPM